MQDPKAQSVFDMINHWLEVWVGYVWNIPLIVLLVGSGVLLSLLVLGGHGLVQWKGFRHAIDVVRGKFDHAGDPGEISHFQALCTALPRQLRGREDGQAFQFGRGQ